MTRVFLILPAHLRYNPKSTKFFSKSMILMRLCKLYLVTYPLLFHYIILWLQVVNRLLIIQTIYKQIQTQRPPSSMEAQ